MIAGGIGNIIDRIRLHFVVDYIEPLFIDFAVFNFADCLITVGAFVLMFYLLVDIIKDEKAKKGKVSSQEFINDETVVEDERN
jgi:signal peptidase II